MNHSDRLYPSQWIDQWQLPNGEEVTVRPVIPKDQSMTEAFVAKGLSQVSRYNRFQMGMHELPVYLAKYFTNIDYHHHFALIVESTSDHGQRQIADARFVREKDCDSSAEFAIMVADAIHGQGLGHRLLNYLIDVARGVGVEKLHGNVLRSNTPMLKLARANGFSTAIHEDGEHMIRIHRDLDPDSLSSILVPGFDYTQFLSFRFHRASTVRQSCY